jgi:hypothetical protein
MDEGGVAVTQRGLRGSPPGVQFNQHLAHRGDVVFEHACKMGLEGIVSRRLGSRYRSGRTSDWLKFTRTRQRPRWASARLPLQRRTIGRLVTANSSLDAGTLQAIDEEAAALRPDARRAFMASAALEKIPAGALEPTASEPGGCGHASGRLQER